MALNEFIYNPYKLKWGEIISFQSTRKLEEFGNRIYNRYPARSVFLVPRAILSNFKNKKISVLDPFMGSGTTAVETVLSGNIPFGTEMDPFARQIADVSTTILTQKQLKELEELYNEIAMTWVKSEPVDLPELTGIERWFKDGDLESLLKLYSCICQTVMSPELKKFMIITFADCIKPVSKMERQSTKPYISSKYPKKTKTVADSFEYSFKAHFKAIKSMSEANDFKKMNQIHWIGTDATNFNSEEELDLAITSPPYINAFDYTQCIKVESALCGFMNDEEVARLRKIQVGQQKGNVFDDALVIKHFDEYYQNILEKNKQKANICKAYFNDITKNLRCVYNVLKAGGEYHIIIGDNTISGIEVPTHEITGNIAIDLGYTWFGYYKYPIKDHRTSIPRDHDTSKIKFEHVIMLRK